MARVQSNTITGHCESRPEEFNGQPSDRAPGVRLTLSESCSLKEWGHLPAACHQRWACPGQVGSALFILDLGPHVIRGITGFHLQDNGLAGQDLHKDLHFDLLVNVKILWIANQIQSPQHMPNRQCQSPLKDFHLFCETSLLLCFFPATKAVSTVHSFTSLMSYLLTFDSLLPPFL